MTIAAQAVASEATVAFPPGTYVLTKVNDAALLLIRNAILYSILWLIQSYVCLIVNDHVQVQNHLSA